MTWLENIEISNKKFRDKRRERMIRALRELAEYSNKLREIALGRYQNATAHVGIAQNNLSEDAIELCVAARESSRERTDAGENNATQ